MLKELIRWTENGLYCDVGDFYLDPFRRVNRALVTHAHADHAIPGSQSYLATRSTVAFMKARMGRQYKYEIAAYGDEIDINGVKVTFYPAGHIKGSAQIKVEYKGRSCVYTGDYKLIDDGISEAYEPITCDTFITECTFGLPVFRWGSQEEVYKEIDTWWRNNAAQGVNSLITVYSLGKAQRLLHNLMDFHGPIYCHGAVENMNQVHESLGEKLPPRISLDLRKKVKLSGALVLAPGAAMKSNWIRHFKPYQIAGASGWLALRGLRNRRNLDQSFVLSDHVDWVEMNQAVKNAEASKVILMHGYTEQSARWFAENGYDVDQYVRNYE